MIKTINNKEYELINEEWFGTNVKGVKYKVTSDKLIEKLADLKVGGLGDLVSKVTTALNIEECEGCAKRKAQLNSIFNWLISTRELTVDEIDFVLDLYERNSRQALRMEADERNRLFALYNEITKSRVSVCICAGLTSQIILRLRGFI